MGGGGGHLGDQVDSGQELHEEGDKGRDVGVDGLVELLDGALEDREEVEAVELEARDLNVHVGVGEVVVGEAVADPPVPNGEDGDVEDNDGNSDTTNDGDESWTDLLEVMVRSK